VSHSISKQKGRDPEKAIAAQSYGEELAHAEQVNHESQRAP
jgi:hypothetical protein